MIDTQFEQETSNAAELLTNDGYFNRVRSLCTSGLSVKEAWEQVESELPFGLHRFACYESFLMARGREARGTIGQPRFVLSD